LLRLLRLLLAKKGVNGCFFFFVLGRNYRRGQDALLHQNVEGGIVLSAQTAGAEDGGHQGRPVLLGQKGRLAIVVELPPATGVAESVPRRQNVGGLVLGGDHDEPLDGVHDVFGHHGVAIGFGSLVQRFVDGRRFVSVAGRRVFVAIVIFDNDVWLVPLGQGEEGQWIFDGQPDGRPAGVGIDLFVKQLGGKGPFPPVAGRFDGLFVVAVAHVQVPVDLQHS